MSLNVLITSVLIGGWVSGKLFDKAKLPPVLGMTIFGVAMSVLFKEQYPTVLDEIAPILKSLALIIILLRAGLGIKRETLQKVGKTALLMAFIPCLAEASVLTLLFKHLMHFSWTSAAICAFLLSAVSPAVVVPSMLNFKEKGYGKRNEIPTSILAAASLDDIFAISMFTIFLSLGQGEDVNLFSAFMKVPYSIIVGLIPGLIAGFLLSEFLKRNHKSIRATEKALLLLGSAVMLLQLGDLTHSAALLGIMSAGFILLERSPLIANELSSKLAKGWVFAEIVLFVLIGMSVDFDVALKSGAIGAAIIGLGLLARSAAVFGVTAFSNLSIKERLFMMIAYLPKATVQAAMGAVPLSVGIAEGEVILAMAVTAIILTAPLGLVGIRIFGPRLLEKA